ncbi:hypothetical protein DLREEDagr8_21320 [Dongia sp. agr-C8]
MSIRQATGEQAAENVEERERHALQQAYLDIVDTEILPDWPYQQTEDLPVDEGQHV